MNETRNGIAILGGSGGLGEAVTRRLARRAPVTIGYRTSAEKATALAEAITADGGAATTRQVDMTDGASVQAFVAGAVEDWGTLDAVVQATGPQIPLCALDAVKEDDFKRIFDTDVFGSFNVIRHASAALKASGGGSIVLFLTPAVLRTLEDDGLSGVPKTAVSALLRQAAREVGVDNVRLNGVAPGVIDAGIVLTSFEVDDVAKAVITSCLAQTPLGRMGQPEEVAALVDFLTSPDATYISGQVIAVDGGYSA
jgi:NAD(P)-dependent dehydrogenase (short-subunit alcohol dehydrogenase family)